MIDPYDVLHDLALMNLPDLEPPPEPEKKIPPPLEIPPVVAAILDAIDARNRILREHQQQEQAHVHDNPIYVCAGGRYPCGHIFHHGRPTVCPRCQMDHRLPDRPADDGA
ncbi:MAG: hypothetical protein ACR2J8_02240 [Thermomicrobiales bacterium]